MPSGQRRQARAAARCAAPRRRCAAPRAGHRRPAARRVLPGPGRPRRRLRSARRRCAPRRTTTATTTDRSPPTRTGTCRAGRRRACGTPRPGVSSSARNAPAPGSPGGRRRARGTRSRLGVTAPSGRRWTDVMASHRRRRPSAGDRRGRRHGCRDRPGATLAAISASRVASGGARMVAVTAAERPPVPTPPLPVAAVAGPAERTPAAPCSSPPAPCSPSAASKAPRCG